MTALADVDIDALVAGVIAGDRRALARSLRVVDDAPVLGRQLVSRLHIHRGGAHVIGLTGNPGAGKSTVVDMMIEHLRRADRSVGVLAVDPSSPFTGGAILGDRIRMSRHFEDDRVFIRSLATRGALGGLSRSVFDSVRLLDAAGYDVILVETVGVGQDEVDVVRLVDTTVVVLVPGLGDDIQAIKAGILEIADIFLLNKADRPGADDLEQGLRLMLTLGPQGPWEVPIIRSVAPRNQGIDTLLATVADHRAFLAGPEGEERRRRQRHDQFIRVFEAILIERERGRLGNELEAALTKVTEEDAEPYAAVAALLGSAS